MTPPSGALAVGTVFAGHRVEAVIGRGGMGVVYKATDLSLERLVALKVIAPELSEDDEFRERFKREARLAASLHHANLISVYAAGDHDGVLYLTMRFVEGTDLRRLLAAEGALAPERAAAIVAHVADALDAAHGRGLVHRDVKPANILLESVSEFLSRAYLTDFGLARLALAGTRVTRPGRVVGTLDYIAPEQLSGGDVDPRTDVYSLACTLYEALTGDVPYPADNPMAKMFAHSNAEPPTLAEAVPHPAEELDAVIRRGMAKNPADRYQSAGELGRAALDASLVGRESAPFEPFGLDLELAGHDQTCGRCSSTAPPLVVAGVSYCADCGVRLDPAAGAAGQPAPRPVAACPTCGSTEPPAVLTSGIYCSTCGRRSNADSTGPGTGVAAG